MVASSTLTVFAFAAVFEVSLPSELLQPLTVATIAARASAMTVFPHACLPMTGDHRTNCRHVHDKGPGQRLGLP
jgi:hypothetical protein